MQFKILFFSMYQKINERYKYFMVQKGSKNRGK